jgi:hypothetical protein
MGSANETTANQAIMLVSMMVAADPRLADECVAALVLKGSTPAAAQAALAAIVAAADDMER